MYSPQFNQPPRPQKTITDQAREVVRSFTPAQWCIMGGGLFGFIGTLLPWYSVTIAKTTLAPKGIDFAYGKAIAIFALVSLLLFVGRYFRLNIPSIPFSDRALFLFLGGEALFLCVLFLLDLSNYQSGLSIGPAIGFYLVALSSIALVCGGYLTRKS
jgi:hypothetical protein